MHKTTSASPTDNNQVKHTNEKVFAMKTKPPMFTIWSQKQKGRCFNTVRPMGPALPGWLGDYNSGAAWWRKKYWCQLVKARWYFLLVHNLLFPTWPHKHKTIRDWGDKYQIFQMNDLIHPKESQNAWWWNINQRTSGADMEIVSRWIGQECWAYIRLAS